MLFSAAVLILLSAAPQLTSPEDALLQVGGYRMHLVVHRGTTPLTIVMESGGGASLDAWAGVDGRLAQRTGATVVAYDRAGFGRSEAGPTDLTPEQQARQLSRALDLRAHDRAGHRASSNAERHGRHAHGGGVRPIVEAVVSLIEGDDAVQEQGAAPQVR